MKFYTSQIPQLITEIQRGNINAIFLHGSNKGYFIEIIGRIIKELKFTLRVLHAKDLTASMLAMHGSSINFFNQKELIKITEVTSIDEDVRQLITTNTLHNFICMIASDNIPKILQTKFFFEKAANLASIGCYMDEPRDIAHYVLQKCKEYNISINEEALHFLKFHLSGDYNIIKTEIEKLFYYVHDKQNITLEDVKSVITLDITSNFTEMCLYYAQQNIPLFLQEVNKLTEEGINAIVILKALTKYYFNLYVVISKIENGVNIDDAIKSLSPPMFFKYIPDFKQVVRSLNSNEIIQVMYKLYMAEIQYKQNPGGFNFIYYCS